MCLRPQARNPRAPRTLSIQEIEATVRDFADAAERAVEAGADDVEIHGANGYLIQQCLSPNANCRTGAYGGAIDQRTRFASEVAAAVATRIGSDRTGIRLSPGSSLGGIDEGPEGPDMCRRLVARLAGLDLAYLHVMHLPPPAVAERVAGQPCQSPAGKPGRGHRFGRG